MLNFSHKPKANRPRCSFCNKLGHTEAKCFLKNPHLKQHAMKYEDDSIYTKTSCGHLKNLKTLVDSGAELSMIGTDLVKRLGLVLRPYKGRKLASVSETLNVLGEVSTTIEVNVDKTSYKQKFVPVVIKHIIGGFDVLLGMDVLKQTPFLMDFSAGRLIVKPSYTLHVKE